jgi:2-hydroxychromene-2-carboxylate isomerase
MSVKVEYHFDFASPNAYLSHVLIPGIERRTGVKVDYVPVLLGGIFKATNNVSPIVAMQNVPNKLAYTQLELRRFIAKHGIVRYQHNPFFPVNSLTIMRGAVAARRLGCFAPYVDVFRHMWEAPKNMDDPADIRAALEESGLPAAQLLELTSDPGVKQELVANTERSVARGTFGTPSFFVGDELFFGKDRLRELEDEIGVQRGTTA